ncbi:unnamed protein product, partial [Urochloa humidicola]
VLSLSLPISPQILSRGARGPAVGARGRRGTRPGGAATGSFSKVGSEQGRSGGQKNPKLGAAASGGEAQAAAVGGPRMAMAGPWEGGQGLLLLPASLPPSLRRRAPDLLVLEIRAAAAARRSTRLGRRGGGALRRALERRQMSFLPLSIRTVFARICCCSCMEWQRGAAMEGARRVERRFEGGAERRRRERERRCAGAASVRRRRAISVHAREQKPQQQSSRGLLEVRGRWGSSRENGYLPRVGIRVGALLEFVFSASALTF